MFFVPKMSNVQRSPASSPSPPPAKRLKKSYALGSINSHEDSYLDEESADCHFVFGSADSDSASSSARIPAHKIILARDSAVFKAMFYGPMKETGDIRLTNVSEAAFKEFLQFFYLAEVELDVENLVDVMHLGHKYMVAKCVDYCINFFKDVHNAENILIGLSLGILYGNLELMTLCERFIAGKSYAVMWSKGFKGCDRQLLAHILDANLFVCSEVELFEACMAWVAAKSGHDDLTKQMVDEHLGELFYNIRFGAMTINEFCSLSDKYEAVLSDDFKAIVKLIGQPHIQQDRFNTQSRQIKWSDPNGVVMKCDREENSQFEEWTVANRIESITFSIEDDPFLFTGLTINKIEIDDDSDSDREDDDETKFPIKIKVVKYNDFTGDGVVVLEMSTNVPLNVTTKLFLPKPLLIAFCYVYEISIEFPCQFFSGFRFHSKALMERVELDCGATVQFHRCKKSHDGEKVIGIISALEFNRI